MQLWIDSTFESVCFNTNSTSLHRCGAGVGAGVGGVGMGVGDQVGGSVISTHLAEPGRDTFAIAQMLQYVDEDTENLPEGQLVHFAAALVVP